MQQINARASFLCARACLPHMLKQNNGHIIVCSPPIDLRMLPGMVGYCMSKFGMTLLVSRRVQRVSSGKRLTDRTYGRPMDWVWNCVTRACLPILCGQQRRWRARRSSISARVHGQLAHCQ